MDKTVIVIECGTDCQEYKGPALDAFLDGVRKELAKPQPVVYLPPGRRMVIHHLPSAAVEIREAAAAPLKLRDVTEQMQPSASRKPQRGNDRAG